MSGDYDFMSKVMCVFMDMDKMIGRTSPKGSANLDRVSSEGGGGFRAGGRGRRGGRGHDGGGSRGAGEDSSRENEEGGRARRPRPPFRVSRRTQASGPSKSAAPISITVFSLAT